MEEAAEAGHLRAPESQERICRYLLALRTNPPSVLLLEGGTQQERDRLGLYWTGLLNCVSDSPPCGQCPACLQIGSGVFRDMIFFRGREGPIRIEDVRNVRRSMGQRPEHGAYRVVVFSEAQELTLAAGNALLKSMEEPGPGNVFLLLVPHRERLLPTLVSRSYAFTLSWTRQEWSDRDSVRAWIELLLDFWRTGRGLFEHTAKKGQLDAHLVQEILSACQAGLLEAASGSGHGRNGLAGFWSRRMKRGAFGEMDNILSKGHEALQHQTNPSLVLDWVALQIRLRLRAGGGAGEQRG
jgi:DNA polymerase-3 subunit delta'